MVPIWIAPQRYCVVFLEVPRSHGGAVPRFVDSGSDGSLQRSNSYPSVGGTSRALVALSCVPCCESWWRRDSVQLVGLLEIGVLFLGP